MSDHIPVLLNEAVVALHVQAGAWYVDATFGRGGHTSAILAQQGKVIAFDVDAAAIEFGQKAFAKEIAEGYIILLRENFENLEKALIQIGHAVQVNSTNNGTDSEAGSINGILFDFGTSSDQLKDEERGFSFEGNAQLDMRMDDRLGVQAKDLLAILPEKQLIELFADFGGEREAYQVAKAIVRQRHIKPISTSAELTNVVLCTKREPRGHIHPATKVFQALRIAVNRELETISAALPQALHVLSAGGRIVTICFHEGEDRIVKQQFRSWEDNDLGEQENKKVVTATQAEIDRNQRSRSAKLRVFIKK
jgi:16S rRNA (cytosine1402-N4)-methyltransferase